MIANSKLIDIVNKLSKKHSLTIWFNPRGIFLSVHLDDTSDSTPDIDAKKFTHLNDLLDFLAEMAAENAKV